MPDLAATDAAAGSDYDTLQPLDAAAVRDRASQLFAGGEGKLAFASGPKLAKKPTLLLVKLVKEVVYDLFTLQRTEVNESAEAAAWAATEAREAGQAKQAELQAELDEHNALVEKIEQKIEQELTLERTATRERPLVSGSR